LSSLQEQAKLEWETQVRELAQKFAEHIERDHEELYEEMRGVAEGAGVDILEIVALNARSEVGRVHSSVETRSQADMMLLCDRLDWRVLTLTCSRLMDVPHSVVEMNKVLTGLDSEHQFPNLFIVPL